MLTDHQSFSKYFQTFKVLDRIVQILISLDFHEIYDHVFF
jgi:hypothetical protein